MTRGIKVPGGYPLVVFWPPILFGEFGSGRQRRRRVADNYGNGVMFFILIAQAVRGIRFATIFADIWRIQWLRERQHECGRRRWIGTRSRRAPP